MFHSIHVFLYDIRFGLLILLFPMFWSMWVFWVYFTTPGKISSGTETHRKRHSHRMRAQQKQSTATMAKEQSAVAVASEEEGNQSNLLDALAAEEDEREASAFQAASTQKQTAIPVSDDKEELVEQLVDNVADKVAAQIEALTGQAVHDDLSEAEAEIVDMQDMLETVQEESSTDNKTLPDTEDDAVEGDHTAAIRKASKMEEIGFHRTTDDDEDVAQDVKELLDNPEVAGLAAKHVARISDLGIVDGPGDEKERLRTAQLDDILGKLDSVLDGDIPSESATSAETKPEEKNEESHNFGNASTQMLEPVTDSGILEAQPKEDEVESIDDQAETIREESNVDDVVEEVQEVEENTDDAEEEANSFFGSVGDEEPAAFEQQETIREESNADDDEAAGIDTAAETIPENDETIQVDLGDANAQDESADFMNEMSKLPEENEQAVDEFDQLETVKVETDRSASFDEDESDSNVDQHDLLETIAVENDSGPVGDPNSETASDENPIEALEQQDETGTDRIENTDSNTDDDDDLPAWARADSFDDDDDDGNSPKQQNLFD